MIMNQSLYFHPLRFQPINSADAKYLREDPLRLHGRDIVEHALALATSCLQTEKTPVADKLRIELRHLLTSVALDSHSYERLSVEIPRLMRRLKAYVYGDGFRKGLPKPVYSEDLFADSMRLLERELHKLSLEEAKVTSSSYKLKELIGDFINVYSADNPANSRWRSAIGLRDDPNRAYFSLLAKLRNEALLEGSYEAQENILRMIAETTLIAGKDGEAELRENARSLMEDLKVEELWDKLTRS